MGYARWRWVAVLGGISWARETLTRSGYEGQGQIGNKDQIGTEAVMSLLPESVLCSVVHCSIVRCGVVWHGVAWCGVVLSGAERGSVVWCGVMRKGVVRWCWWCGGRVGFWQIAAVPIVSQLGR